MSSRAPADPALLESIRSWVETNLGIHFGASDMEQFRSRLSILCRREHLSARQIHARLTAGDHGLMLRVGQAFSTNYTTFFREPEVFDAVRTRVVPSLPADGELRIWSAAASSGEEAYSLAIFFQELWGQQAALARVRILATDISDAHVRSAERGVFSSQAVNSLVSEERRRIYFEPAGSGQFRVAPSLRQMCTFRRLNLIQSPWPFEQRFHLVFLRNVLYYFESDVQRRVLEACYDVTERRGWLVTSLTEPMLDSPTRWRMAQPALFRKGG